MNFLRRVFANGLDADLIRLFRMLLPYNLQVVKRSLKAQKRSRHFS